MRVEPVEVAHEAVTLRGSLWFPAAPPRTLVVMHPGSGPSDRDNDTYFAPIRTILLDGGHAVASFDKRGVGASTGVRSTSTIEQQAGDLLACVAVLRARLPSDVAVGAFGHSQGGWVVYDAAARRQGLRFVVANSGPGVSVAEQERYALAVAMSGHPHRHAALEAFDRLVAWADARTPHHVVVDALTASTTAAARAPVAHLVDSDEAWRLARGILAYDPDTALSRIDVPLLALFGADDRIVPVDASVAALARTVDPELLTVAVLPHGDHRLHGPDGRLVPGYDRALRSFVDASTT